MASKPELYYFNGRGRGEIVRMVLAAVGIEFTEVYLLTREDYLAIEDDLPYGQVPLLKIDGQNIVQTQAMVRYVARKGNLLGEKEPDKTKIDTLYEGSRDFFQIFLLIGFVYDESKLVDHMQSIVKYLAIFNKALKENGTGYHVGSHLTLADVGVLEPLLGTIDYFGQEILDDYPDLQKFFKTVTGLERISKYIKEIRKPRNTPEYVATVRRVLLGKELGSVFV